mgnify:CR=1 FL=1
MFVISLIDVLKNFLALFNTIQSKRSLHYTSTKVNDHKGVRGSLSAGTWQPIITGVPCKLCSALKQMYSKDRCFSVRWHVGSLLKSNTNQKNWSGRASLPAEQSPLLTQSLMSTADAEQCKPPLAGIGFVQLRNRVWEPPPQDIEQALHSLHSVQPPFTKITMQLEIIDMHNTFRFPRSYVCK